MCKTTSSDVESSKESSAGLFIQWRSWYSLPIANTSGSFEDSATDEIQLEFIDYPLDRLAVIAAALARTLPSDEGYVKAIDILLQKQKQWAYSKKPLEGLYSIAKLFGVSSKEFDGIKKNNFLVKFSELNSENEVLHLLKKDVYIDKKSKDKQIKKL